MEAEAVKDWKDTLRTTIIEISQLMAMLVAEDMGRVVSNQGLLERFFINVDAKRAKDVSIPYLSVVPLLTSMSKPISHESIRSILISVKIEPDERLLDFAGSLDLGKTAPCVPVIYFLKVLEKDISPENIIKVLNSVDILVDRTTALHVMSIYHTFITSESKRDEADSILKNALGERFAGTASITAKELLLQLERTFEFKDINEVMKKYLIYYISTMGVLAFLGKDIDDKGDRNMEGLISMLEAIDFKPNVEMISYIKSRFAYGFAPAVYGSAINFLDILGKPVNTESVLGVLKGAGVRGREDVAGYIITLWKESS